MTQQGIHPSVVNLLTHANVPLVQVTLIRHNRWRFRCKSGQVVANIQRLKSSIKIAVPKRKAQKQGLTNWNRSLCNGWYKSDDEVYWYIADGNNTELTYGARVLQKLY